MSRFDARAGGIATAAGYALVFVLMFRHPIRALDAVNADLPGTIYFVGIPAAGVLAGAYASRDGPGSAAVLVLAGPVLVWFAVVRPIGPIEAELPVAVVLGLVLVLGLLGTAAGVLAALPTVRSWVASDPQ